jgi:hypothetical protein
MPKPNTRPGGQPYQTFLLFIPSIPVAQAGYRNALACVVLLGNMDLIKIK